MYTDGWRLFGDDERYHQDESRVSDWGRIPSRVLGFVWRVGGAESDPSTSANETIPLETPVKPEPRRQDLYPRVHPSFVTLRSILQNHRNAAEGLDRFGIN